MSAASTRARSTESMELLEDVLRSVVAGRVVEVTAGDRLRIEVTHLDGSVAVETGRVGVRSLLPKPGWQRWGRRMEHAPYLGVGAVLTSPSWHSVGPRLVIVPDGPKESCTRCPPNGMPAERLEGARVVPYAVPYAGAS